MTWWIYKKIFALSGFLKTTLAQTGGTGSTGGTGYTGGTGSGGTTLTLINPLACKGAAPNDLVCVANAITTALLQVSIPIVAIMVLIGGFQILTAGGDPEKFKTGRKTIMYAVIGFAVIFVARGVVSIIQSLLTP